MLIKIKGAIKNYSWGGYTYLPGLLGIDETGEPFGEYWLGTHPDGPAVVVGTDLTLTENLGRPLSFLMKVLDVRDMLSIQVHPDKKTAETGFALEEKMGKPREAPDRVFKDENHKPELMVALSEFWLVQGFRSHESIVKTLTDNSELKPILEHYLQHGLRDTYRFLMTMPQEGVNEMLKPLGQRIKPLYESGQLDKSDINFWSSRAYFSFNKKGICDRGIFSLYLMNLVQLNPGEGIYQAPGVLHAYLEGQNIECMAASDNVVRGGLTQKHIDTNLLLDIVRFNNVAPQIISPESKSGSQSIYSTPATEFFLSQILDREPVSVENPCIVLNMGTPVTIYSGAAKESLRRGEALFVNAETELRMEIFDPGQPIKLFLAEGR